MPLGFLYWQAAIAVLHFVPRCLQICDFLSDGSVKPTRVRIAGKFTVTIARHPFVQEALRQGVATGTGRAINFQVNFHFGVIGTCCENFAIHLRTLSSLDSNGSILGTCAYLSRHLFQPSVPLHRWIDHHMKLETADFSVLPSLTRVALTSLWRSTLARPATKNECAVCAPLLRSRDRNAPSIHSHVTATDTGVF